MTDTAGPSEPPQTLFSHLLELRSRLLKIVAAVSIVFVALVAFSDRIYAYLAAPLVAVLPEGSSIIATNVAAPFLTPIKLTIAVAFFAAIPYVLYQVWAFVAPALYKHERRMALPLVISSTLLFYAGMAFAYFVVFPLAFGFFAAASPEGVTMATDISSYLSFTLKLFFAFGMAFEIPIATVILCWSGITTPAALAAKRPYVIVGVFVVGMLMTPPDVISQTLLALPMWALFELGLLFSRFYSRALPADERSADAER